MSPIDLALLRAHATFEDPRLGIRERFLTPTLDGVGTVAVLGTPLGVMRSTGWLVCASFGPEQSTLMPLDVALARRLAAAGHPVLRYHGRGYGDSQDASVATPGPDAHVADAVAAARILREETGVGPVGLIGTRFGASIAILAAETVEADLLVLIEPVTDGRAYVRSLLVRARAAEMQGASDAGAAAERDRTATVDVDGFPIPATLVDAFAGIDVLRAAAAFRGRSVIVQVGRREDPVSEQLSLAETLGAGDGRCSVRSIVHPDAHRLGLPRFRKVVGDPPDEAPGRKGTRRVDVQRDLVEAIIGPVVGWTLALVVDAPLRKAVR